MWLIAFGFGDLASAISGGLTVSRVNNKAIKVQNDRRTHSENVYNTYRNSGYQPKKLSYHQDNAPDYAEYVKHCKALADDLQYTDLFNEYFANTFEELSENEQQAIVDDMIEWDTEMYNKLRCKFATDSFNDVVDYALP